jgi:site-specific DNA-methyltransferase (adenine-specific)
MMDITDKLHITNEDCMELLKRTPDNFYDLALVDPPYGIGEAGGEKTAQINSKVNKSASNSIQNMVSKNGIVRCCLSKEYFIELVTGI